MQQIGRYEVLEEIARGGMGVVFRAQDPLSKRKVAIKVLLDPDPDPRFQQEIDALARLQHPGIVSFYEMAQDGAGRDFVVMELVEGESLQDRLKRDGPLPIDDAVDLILQLCDALTYAHGRGVLHRDLKPHNVLVTQDGRVKLTDFGLGKIVNQTLDSYRPSLTKTGEIMGTPAYMPPEQAAGEKDRVGPRSDVYSLGATLYALLTGRPPFEGHTVINIVYDVIDKAPLRPSKRRADVPAELDAIVLRCLEKQPAARYDSVADLATALGGGSEAAESPAAAGDRSGLTHWVAAGILLVGLAGALGVALRGRAGVKDDAASVTPTGSAADPTQAQTAPPEATPETSDGSADEAMQQVRLAYAAARDEDYELAERAYTEAIRLKPDFAEAYVNRAGVYSDQGKHAQAIDDCSQAIQLGLARPFLAYLNRGIARTSLSDFQGAIEDFEVAIRLEPENAHAYFKRGFARQRLRQDEAAHEDYNEAIRLLPDHSGAYSARGGLWALQGRNEEALSDFSRAIELGRTGAKALIDRGSIRARLGSHREAVEDFTEAIRLQPGEPFGYLRRAGSREALGDYRGAIEDATEAIRLDPGLDHAFYTRGRALTKTGESAGAVADFTEALRLRPDHASAFTGRGIAKNGLGDSQGAIEDLTEAIRLDPREAENFNSRGIARLNLGDARGAIEDCTEAIRLRDSHMDAYFNRGLAHAALGSYREAIADYSAAIRLRPELAGPYYHRGSARAIVGELQAASDDLTEALRLEPTLGAAAFVRGRLRLLAGDLPKARADLRSAHELTPDLYAALWLTAVTGDPQPLATFARAEDWGAELARYVRGEITAEDLLRRARAVGDEEAIGGHLCEAHGYIGLLLDLSGDRRAAKGHYEACVATGVSRYAEYHWAQTRLRQWE